MRNYSTTIQKQPQTRPILGRTDMVKNNAGGYVFEATHKQILERFLLIGSEGGTYYTSEQKLTEDNAQNVIRMIRSNGIEVVNTTVDVLVNNRAPKVDASLFVLALAATHGNQETKNAVYTAIPKVCRTGTQLFTFVANIQNLRGWSRGLRKAIAKFYTDKTADNLAYQLVKYRNRAGFTHRDVIRLSHPNAKGTEINNILRYAVGRSEGSETSSNLIRNFTMAQKAANDETLIEAIRRGKLTWEMVPTDKLNNPNILAELAPNMPLTALIRNLNRFSNAGLFDRTNTTFDRIRDTLTSDEVVRKSNLHPVNVINYMVTYAKGRGTLGSKTWNVSQKIVDDLQKTYELSLKNVTPTNKRMLVAVDVSGSMNKQVSGMALSASQIANVASVSILKTEPKADMIWFDTQCRTPKIGARHSIDQIINLSATGGGTDCSAPIRLALDNKLSYDVIVIFTDNETWAGNSHQLQVVEKYRKTINPNVKIVEVAMVANPYSQLPLDKNFLRVVGFDSSVMEVINKFILE